MISPGAFLVDSSGWLEYFLSQESGISSYIDKEDRILLASVISIHEIKKKLLHLGKHRHEIEDMLNFIKSNSVLLEVTAAIAEKSVSDCLNHRLTTADALIYRTAIENNLKMLTYDNDFQKLDGVVVFRK